MSSAAAASSKVLDCRLSLWPSPAAPSTLHSRCACSLPTLTSPPAPRQLQQLHVQAGWAGTSPDLRLGCSSSAHRLPRCRLLTAVHGSCPASAVPDARHVAGTAADGTPAQGGHILQRPQSERFNEGVKS